MVILPKEALSASVGSYGIYYSWGPACPPENEFPIGVVPLPFQCCAQCSIQATSGHCQAGIPVDLMGLLLSLIHI